MKKLLFLLTCTLFLLGSCSSDDDNKTLSVSSIKLENVESDLFVGGEYQLRVSHTPIDLDAPAYTWESSNPDIATIDKSGKLKALKEGQATIKVIATSLNLASNLNITVRPIDATSIKLDKQTHEIGVGQSFTLTYKIEPENTTNKNVTWKSSNESIATVSKEGVITTLSDGDIIITASLGSLSDECKITVTPIKVSSIVLNETVKEIEVLESFQLTPTITPNNAKNKNVVWKSSDENIAIVDNTGKVSTKSVGNATITVTSEDGGFAASSSILVYNFTKNISVGVSISTTVTSWGTTRSTNGELKNNSKKTIIAKKIYIYEDGSLLSTKDISDTLIPGGKISYGVQRHGNFSFVYEYNFNGKTYTTLQ